ncbi:MULTISPECIES: hypothetical protein [Bacillus]
MNNITTFMQGLMKHHPEVKKPCFEDSHKVEEKSF